MEGYTPGPGGCSRADCFFLDSLVQIRVVSLALSLRNMKRSVADIIVVLILWLIAAGMVYIAIVKFKTFYH